MGRRERKKENKISHYNRKKWEINIEYSLYDFCLKLIFIILLVQLRQFPEVVQQQLRLDELCLFVFFCWREGKLIWT